MSVEEEDACDCDSLRKGDAQEMIKYIVERNNEEKFEKQSKQIRANITWECRSKLLYVCNYSNEYEFLEIIVLNKSTNSSLPCKD